MSQENRTPLRTLVFGYTGFSGLDSVSWEDQIIPNISDYDSVVVSVPHITEEFLDEVTQEYLRELRKSLLQFLHSRGKLIILYSRNISAERPDLYERRVWSTSWCPFYFNLKEECGKSIVQGEGGYEVYLDKMVDWDLWMRISDDFPTSEMTDTYGPAHTTQYSFDLFSYAENRYGRILAGRGNYEVRNRRAKRSRGGGTSYYFPEDPDTVSGDIIFLPLIRGISPEEALLDILKLEVGYSLKSPLPDWASQIELPDINALTGKLKDAEQIIVEQEANISKLQSKIDHINSFKRLLFSTGNELEDVVSKTFQLFGATITPAKYSQEEYILEFEGREYLMEVKGVSKSVSLSHLRQLIDYLLEYEEDNGKPGKGILFGNAWRLLPPEQRDTKDQPVFPGNVVSRAVDMKISLLSSITLFEGLCKVLSGDVKGSQILKDIVEANGIVEI